MAHVIAKHRDAGHKFSTEERNDLVHHASEIKHHAIEMDSGD
jgi:hypothetical protein